MTSTTDTAGHPDVTEISDLTEGLLSAPRAEELLRHLDACASCAEVHASLEEIQRLLGAPSEPLKMPRNVADRIDAALAAERHDVTTAGPISDRDATAARVSRETSLANRPAGHTTTGTGPGRTSRTRRGRRRVAVLGTAFAVAALGVASIVVASQHGHEGYDSTAHARPSTSADTFAEETLKNRVATLLDKTQKTQSATHTPQHTFGAHSGSDTDGPATDLPNVLKSAPTAPVPSCVQQGIDSSAAPLAAEEGTYSGENAYLVVLPDASGNSTRVTAYVVDATCVHHASAPAKVLFSHSYARH